MGFACEYLGGTVSSPPQVYQDVDFTLDGTGYTDDMTQIPWNKLKVLATWDGS